MQLDGEHRGNATRAAQAMGVTRPTYEQHLEAARKKLGGLAPTKAETRAIRSDRRGQPMVTEDRRRDEL